jgi:NADH:ubiquinone oxidoreductase subunit 4 (subunit M)
MLNAYLLAILIWLPIVGGFAVLGLADRVTAARRVSLAIAAATFLCSIPLWASFETGTAVMQFVERTAWIPAIHAEFYVGVDGISMPLILLTTLTTVLVVISGWRNVEKRIAQYFAAFLILEGVILRFLGGHAASDVHHHRHLGRPAPGIRHDQVLSLHLPRLVVDAGRLDLPVSEIGQLRTCRIPAHAVDTA